jgi:hypothetical protein
MNPEDLDDLDDEEEHGWARRWCDEEFVDVEEDDYREQE